MMMHETSTGVLLEVPAWNICLNVQVNIGSQIDHDHGIDGINGIAVAYIVNKDVRSNCFQMDMCMSTWIGLHLAKSHGLFS